MAASGSVRVWPDATLAPRAPSNVGVVSLSSIALPLRRAPRLSGELTLARMLLSEALEGRREGNWRGICFDAGGGMEMLVRSALPLFVSGSAPRAFLLGAVALPEEERTW
jgi:hypothetical protein